MQLNVYSVYDAKTKMFINPWVQITHGSAERHFQQLVNDPQSTIYPFPEDYDLYFLGTFDNVTGKYSPLDSPQHHLKAIQVKQPGSPMVQQ